MAAWLMYSRRRPIGMMTLRSGRVSNGMYIAMFAISQTYSKRTENANTTIAFSLNFMRNDQTNSNDMPEMKTSSATAVSSTPFHRRHYSWSVRVSAMVSEH